MGVAISPEAQVELELPERRSTPPPSATGRRAAISRRRPRTMTGSREQLGDRVGRGGDVEPAHTAFAERANSDVDGEDVAEQPCPRLSLGSLALRVIRARTA